MFSEVPFFQKKNHVSIFLMLVCRMPFLFQRLRHIIFSARSSTEVQKFEHQTLEWKI